MNQEMATKNQITTQKPSVPNCQNILTGHIANSLNGGHIKPIGFKKVMAGERITNLSMQMHIKMLTPLTPTYQNLKMQVKAYFVPNSRVWENAEKYTAQKGGSNETKITEIPNLGGLTIPLVTIQSNGADSDYKCYLSDTTAWRDSYISTYIPRLDAQRKRNGLTNPITLPKMSGLPIRGFKAIYNDFERNKEYDTALLEYKSDTITQTELNESMPINTMNFLNKCKLRAKRQNSYYTDYRTEVQGFEIDAPNLSTETNDLITWATWESKIAEARSQAENAQLNDWDIIAKIRGSQPLSEGKVQLIGKKTFNLNYSAITQNTYNTNATIKEEFRVLGQQGAYSYTEIKFDLVNYHEFKEEGYIHYIAIVSADTVFESAIDRNELNVTPLDEYRPDLINVKNDVLYKAELGAPNSTQYYQVIGFKRKFSEYFKLPNNIAGDMLSENYYESLKDTTKAENEVETNKTFQFYEKNGTQQYIGEETIVKNIWKDYTDLMINKNQAIMNEIIPVSQNKEIIMKGQNQIFFVGQVSAIVDLPIDPSIKNNFTKWGEH